MKATQLTHHQLDLQLARGRLQAVVDEAGVALARSAFSPIIREAKDFACSLLTPEGYTIAQSRQSAPLFLGTASHTAEALKAAVPESEWEPGDVLGTNDPWMGTGHLNDLNICAPIFVGDGVVAIAHLVAHLSDIGGRSMSLGIPSIFEEGFRIPPMRLGTLDRLDPLLEDLLRANVRFPDEVVGDVEALLNSASLLAGQTKTFVERLGVSSFRALQNELEIRSETYFGDVLASLEDGRYQAVAEVPVDKDTSVRLRVALAIAGRRIHVDFAGTSPQVDLAINSCLAATKAYTFFALKCLLAPDTAFSAGLLRPVTVSAPPESIVSSTFPAAGSARHLVSNLIPGLVFQALAPAVPEAVIAGSASPTPFVTIHGFNPRTATTYGLPIYVPGGLGARATRDGLSCATFPINTDAVPVEILEAEAPIVVERQELIQESAGGGRCRGGMGQRLSLRSTSPAEVSVLVLPGPGAPEGVNGGGSGAPTKVFVNGKAFTDVHLPLQLLAGDLLTIESAGGGGYGSASELAEPVGDGQ